MLYIPWGYAALLLFQLNLKCKIDFTGFEYQITVKSVARD